MSKLITFFGGDSQVGTTSIAASAAQALKGRGSKVLLILASSEIEEEWFSNEPKADLGILLRSNKVTRDDLDKSIIEAKEFDFIRGIKDPLKKQFFEPKMLSQIKTLKENEYDYILIDGGHDITLPLCIEALSLADKRYYILTGNQKCLTRFKVSLVNVIEGLGIDLDSDKLIINKESRKGITYDADAIKNMFSKEGFSVPKYDNPETYEFDKTCPYGKAGSAYQKAIGMIVTDIIS